MDFLEKLYKAGYSPEYDHNKKLNIEAMLPAAFARSVKMMRFIDSIYDEDKERFFRAAQKSSRRNSRFISANRIKIRLNAMKAQGVYMASLEDEELAARLLEQAERAFSKLSNLIKDFGTYAVSYGYIFEQFEASFNESDDALHDFTALFIYFCDSYNMKIDEDDSAFTSSMLVITEKEEGHLRPYNQIVELMLNENAEKTRKIADELNRQLSKVVPGKSFAEMWKTPPGQKESNFYQVLWDLGQLEGFNLSMFERETFSAKELRDITNVITVRAFLMQATGEDIPLYYMTGVLLRSIFRGYRELIDMIDEYSGIVRESEKNKNLARMAAAQNNRIIELEALSNSKQNSLNDSQMEIDRLKKLLEEKEEQIQQDKERIAILEQLAAEEEAFAVDDTIIHEDKAEYLTGAPKALNAHVVIFGGPNKWQNQIKSIAPNYICISVDNNTFDKKIISKADAVVFKTDYLSHKQWSKVRDHAKKCGRKIVYCRNNLQFLFSQIEKAIG